MEGGGEEADPRLCQEGTPTLWPLSTDEKGASVSKMQGAEGPRGEGGAGRGVGVGAAALRGVLSGAVSRDVFLVLR